MRQAAAFDDWARARAHQDRLQSGDPTAAAAEYFAAWPDHPPDYFRDSTRRRKSVMRQAFGDGNGWACRLSSCVVDLHRYNLHHHHLGLSKAAAAPELLFDDANIKLWQQAVRAAFTGPVYWARELGEDGHVHVHVLAGAEAGLLHIPRGGQVAGLVWCLEGLLTYWAKPAAPYTAGNLALWLKAKRRGRLPRMSGTLGLPNTRTWGCPQPNPVPSVFIIPAQQSDPIRRAASTASEPQPSGSIIPTASSEPIRGFSRQGKAISAPQADHRGVRGFALKSCPVNGHGKQGSRLHSRPSRSITAEVLASPQTAPAQVIDLAGRGRYSISIPCAAPRRGPAWSPPGVSPPGHPIGP